MEPRVSLQYLTTPSIEIYSKLFQSCPHNLSVKLVLMLLFYLRIASHVVSVLQIYQKNVFYEFPICPIRATCPPCDSDFI